MKSDVATLCLLAFALLSLARGSQANPIEKVLEMISDLQAKVLGEGQTWSWIICSIIALGAAFYCGRFTERKAILTQRLAEADAEINSKAKPTAKAKPKAKRCQHVKFTTAGSNQYKLRKRCLACGEVFDISDLFKEEDKVDKGP